MRRTSKVVVFIFMLLSCAPLLQSEAVTSPVASPLINDPGEEPEVLISMDFKNADLKDILKVFSIQSGMNFIASEAVQDRKMTLYLEKVPIEKAMDQIFKANNLSYELDKEANIFIVKEWGTMGPELITKVFYLKHASVSSSSMKEEMKNQVPGSETSTTCSTGSSGGGGGSGGSGSGGKWKAEENSGITEIVKKLLSKDGTVVEDYRTNSLIVTDVPSRIQSIAQVIASLDVSVPQVLIEVEMLDVKKEAVDQLGVKWPQGIVKLDITGTRVTSFPFSGSKAFQDLGETLAPKETAGGWENVEWPGKKWGPTIISVINDQLVLDFLSSRSDTKFLARPKIFTLNNETAEIKISTNEAIGLVSTTSGTSGTTTESAERMATGVVLRVTPQVNLDTGEITMFVVPIVTEANVGGTFGVNQITFKDPEVRSTKSIVRVKDGETIVLGGLIRNKTSETDTTVPILSKIPLVGALFRHKSRPGDQDRELLVFITPHIVNDSAVKKTNIALTQSKKIAAPEREQSAMAGINRQTAISGYLNNMDQRTR